MSPISSGSAAEPFDLTRLKEMFGDDKAMIGELLKLFIDTTTPQIAEIKTALTNANHDAVKKLGHQIKGSAANLGLNELRDIGYALEKNSTDSAQVTELCAAMPEALQRVSQALAAL